VEHNIILISSHGEIFNWKSFKGKKFPNMSIDAAFVKGSQSVSYDVEYVYEFGKIVITKFNPHVP
jgi:hypothetical protein